MMLFRYFQQNQWSLRTDSKYLITIIDLGCAQLSSQALGEGGSWGVTKNTATTEMIKCGQNADVYNFD